MFQPRRIPDSLFAGPFTVAEACAANISYGKLRHADVLRLSRGIKSMKTEGDTSLALLTRPYTLVTGYSTASHATAFEIWEFPGFLPGAGDPGIHIARQFPHTTPRRVGVVGHRTQFWDDEVEFLDGLWITTRVRTWLDCARKMSIDELVVVADHLLRIPRPAFEGRTRPYATSDQLAAMLDRHWGTPGIRKAREALAMARVGSDSAPETRLRLAVVRAGLPEPELNVPTRLANGVERSPDQAFRDYRVAVEYEGDHHSGADQVVRDITRDEDYLHSGWLVVRISKRHMANEARPAVDKIGEALRSRGWPRRATHL
ncbi:hypothetical protein [Specibacter cremeus]|uniref:hypothetical protein n=1 Tax=Specibacter cremeus TaxID=1629051 RepID=UPI000F784EAB|nr:hypothetical protein [Specibacter cremeus]